MKTTDYWTDDKDGYLERNQYLDPEGLKIFFDDALMKLAWGGEDDVKTVCEYGCNIGLNLTAINSVLSVEKLYGFDVNFDAVEIANELEDVTAEYGNLLVPPSENKYDLVLTKGLLIHIDPEQLEIAYQNLHYMTNKYLLICEYYNPTPVEVEYHGKSGLLFKRDFAGDMLDKFPDLRLVDYGFRYHRDEYPQDDITWFLLKKETK